MAKHPTLPLYYNDISRTCSTWTDEEFGCYMRLLMEQWDKGFIPKEPERIARLVTSFEKTWPILKDKFKEIDGVLKNERMEEVREKQRAFKDRNTENGSKGGRPKKTQTKPKRNPNINPNINPEKSPRVENENTIYCKYIEGVNNLLGKRYKGSDDVKRSLAARISEGRTLEEILLAVKNAARDEYHIGTGFKYLTPEFFTRANKLDKFSQSTEVKIQRHYEVTEPKDYEALTKED